MDEDLQIIHDSAGNIGALMSEIEPITETEQFLVNLVQELCMHIVEMAEAMEDDEA